MNETPAAKLFKEPGIWPNLAPWWLVSSTEAAALLNVKPAALHTWRFRGFGPPVFPPMYVRPTQGCPLYFQYGALRAWAASRIGIAYEFDDQCMDFFRRNVPQLVDGTGSVEARIQLFNNLFQEERRSAQTGKKATFMPLNIIQDLDLGFSRQPDLVVGAPRNIPLSVTTS